MPANLKNYGNNNFYESVNFCQISITYVFQFSYSHNEAFQVYCHLAQDDSQMLQKFEVFLEEAVQKIKEQSKAKDALEVAFDR